MAWTWASTAGVASPPAPPGERRSPREGLCGLGPVSVADVEERATRRRAIVAIGSRVRLREHLGRKRVLRSLIEAGRAEVEVAVAGLVVLRQARPQRVGRLARGDVGRSALESQQCELLGALARALPGLRRGCV